MRYKIYRRLKKYKSNTIEIKNLQINIFINFIYIYIQVQNI